MCERIRFENGDVAVICGSRGTASRYCACGRAGKLLCDWKAPHRRSGTCDRPICALHAKEVAPGKHLCPEHQRAFEDWKKRAHLSDDQVRRKIQGTSVPEQGILFLEA